MYSNFIVIQYIEIYQPFQLEDVYNEAKIHHETQISIKTINMSPIRSALLLWFFSLATFLELHCQVIDDVFEK